MKILLIALGSHGDVHPFVGIGLALRRRGHHVTVAANEYFKPLIEKVELPFAQLGSAEDYRKLAGNPDLWHERKAFKVVFGEGVVRFLPEMYELVAQHQKNGGDVVAASSLALGARIAQDKLGIPMATVHLQPGVLRSVYETPVFPGLAMPGWWPKSFKRAMFWGIDKFIVDPLVGPPINSFRAQLGLPPVKKILDTWWNSPQLTIGLFPEWYAPPQPDWPSQVRLTGFPLYDEGDHSELPDELKRFLDAGDPPIIFTPGSAMWAADKFFEQSAAACAMVGKRGVLLSRHRDHIPKNLPTGVIHIDYAPFSQLLPRAAVLVHHGGIGTSAQALAAGVPQLITPFTHDQPDNAARLKRLGVADVIKSRAYRAPKIAAVLASLTASPQIAASAQAIQSRLMNNHSIDKTCELLEGLA